MGNLEKEIYNIINPSIESEGFNIVLINLINSNGESKKSRAILQILIEKQDLTGVTLNDCSILSKKIAILLDVADLIKERYSLEISSPGIDRPLTKLEDFIRFIGQRAFIKLKMKQKEQKNFKGIIKAVEDNKVLLETEEEEILIDFDNIFKANLDILSTWGEKK